MTHSHHAQGSPLPHSHSPNRAGAPERLHTQHAANSPRSLRQERPGYSHSHGHSESHHHGHSHSHSHSHNHDHNHNSLSGDLHSPPNTGLSLNGQKMDHQHILTPTKVGLSSFEPPSGTVTVEHAHASAGERSRFTGLMLSYTEGISLLHSILIEKDSRRIFYFMRYGQFIMTFGMTLTS
jgi:hypothetical protein